MNVLRRIWIPALCAVLAFGLGSLVGGRGGATQEETSREAKKVYTCSMHPSVRLFDPDARCPICSMELIEVTEGASGLDLRQLALTPEAVALAQIRTSPVTRFFPTASLRLFGRVEVDQTRVARVAAQFPGRIEALFTNYVGVPVREGDHLVELYSPALISAFEELRQARRAQDRGRESNDLVRTSHTRTLEAAREKLRLLGVEPSRIEEIETAPELPDRWTVRSPIGGVVTQVGALEGEYVETGSVLVTVADLGRLWLELDAYESQLPLLRWGQKVRFEVASQPGEEFEGRISFLSPVVDEGTRTARVRVAVDNSDGRLKPGLFATSTVQVRVGAVGAVGVADYEGKWVSPMHPEVVKNQPGVCDVCGMDLVRAEELGIAASQSDEIPPLVVPTSAILATGQRELVYVEVGTDGKPVFEAREVVLGARADDLTVVREGLSEGDRVVTHGAFKIDSEMQITGRASLMSSDSASRVPRVEVDAKFREGLGELFDVYLDRQEALAADDFSRDRELGEAWRAALEDIDDSGLAAEPASQWQGLQSSLQSVEPGPEDLATARAAFEKISDAMLEVESRFGHSGSQSLREVFCPMAFGNTGARWLQRGSDVLNPYFGASMLRCGEIRAVHAPLTAPDRPRGHDHE